MRKKKGVIYVTEQADKNIREVRRGMRHEKIKVLIWPIAIASFVYGVQLMIFPSILENYQVYNIINDFVNNYVIGAVFIINALIMTLSFLNNTRSVLIVSSALLLALWSMFSVAFVLSPPPNTVWVFSALMTYLTFSLARRV